MNFSDNVSSWELVERVLHNEGWSLGWCKYSDGNGGFIWSVDGHRGFKRIAVTGKTLNEAFGKFYFVAHNDL